MTKRKSFVIHIDSLDILDDLTDEQAGQLFKAIKSHQLDDDIELSPIVKIAFSPFKNQFGRDDGKYQKLCEKNKLIAENRYSTKSTTGTSGSQPLPTVTKSTDNDSKSDNDSDSKSEVIVPSSNSTELTEKVVKSKFKFSEADMTFATWMFGLVEIVSPSAKKPNFESWANVIRLMRESDGFEHRHMAETFKWANQDSFWYVNILSPKKLREKFAQLDAKRMQGNGGNNEKVNNGINGKPRKLSAAERIRERNDIKYGRVDSSGLAMGENGRDIRGAMDEGERGGRIIDVESSSGQAISRVDQDWGSSDC